MKVKDKTIGGVTMAQNLTYIIDGQVPYLYKHIFSQSELSKLLHGSIKSDTESFASVIVASV